MPIEVDLLDVRPPEGSITRASGFDPEGNIVWFWGPTPEMRWYASALRVFGFPVTVWVDPRRVERVRLLEEAA